MLDKITFPIQIQTIQWFIREFVPLIDIELKFGLVWDQIWLTISDWVLHDMDRFVSRLLVYRILATVGPIESINITIDSISAGARRTHFAKRWTPSLISRQRITQALEEEFECFGNLCRLFLQYHGTVREFHPGWIRRVQTWVHCDRVLHVRRERTAEDQNRALECVLFVSPNDRQICSLYIRIDKKGQISCIQLFSAEVIAIRLNQIPITFFSHFPEVVPH